MSLALGIDAGSTTTKAVLVDDTGSVLNTALTPTGGNGVAAAGQVRDEVLEGRDESDVSKTVSTGYGRARIGFADKAITEITCHAAGVHSLHAETRSIIDIGGQDAKVIRLGDDGRVQDFAMNDRCAAGTGSFLDVLARRFGWNVRDLPVSSEADAAEIPEISSTCVVFAESEVVGLLAKGYAPGAIIAAVHRAIARRVTVMAKQAGIAPPARLAGGVALNEGLRLALEKELGFPLPRAEYAQFTGALGAALLAL